MQDRLLEIAKVVLGELDVGRVLTTALDGVIELCGAERGMILLFDREGEILFERARNLDRRDVRNPEFEISRSIIQRVRSEGSPFFAPDLPAHPGGNLGDSVHRLGLMAVMCLPMSHRGEVFGVVYLDNRSRRHVFTEETLALVESFSEFISLAAHNALERRNLESRVDSLERELRGKYRFDAIVGRDPKMLEVLKLVAQVAESDATVLIEGESGTGKELVARAIHFNSHRRDRPFVPINCGALPEALQESELFGHRRGAFTGAVRDHPGWFEQAERGTIFLDEVGEMSPALQVKLLRVLETGEYSRVGSTTLRRADVRIVAATNRDLETLVGEGTVRRDLHYRLAVIQVSLPPLRERRSDIPLLVRHFLDRQRKEGAPQWRLAPAAEAALCAYDFPGNVRELQNMLQRAVLVAGGPVIELDHLPAQLSAGNGDGAAAGSPLGFKEAKRRVVADFERGYVCRCLRDSGGNITRAAQAAGIDVKNFHAKMTRYRIDAGEFKKKEE